MSIDDISTIAYVDDDNHDYVVLEIRVSVEQLLSDGGVSMMHDYYFDCVKQMLLDLEEDDDGSNVN